MKKSNHIVLVISGAAALSLTTGCDRPNYNNSYQPRAAQAAEQWVEDTQSYTNNQYVPGQGYYHSAARSWYPYPYNHYVPGQGFYSGGTFHQNRLADNTSASRPLVRSTAPSTSSGSRSAAVSTTSRGGFGGSASSVSS